MNILSISFTKCADPSAKRPRIEKYSASSTKVSLTGQVLDIKSLNISVQNLRNGNYKISDEELSFFIENLKLLFNSTFNRRNFSSKFIEFYGKFITKFKIENSSLKTWLNKIEGNLENFNVKEAITFILDHSLLNNCDHFQLSNFLSKWIKFINSFQDQGTKNRLANYFMDSKFFSSELKSLVFLLYNPSYEGLLFLEKNFTRETFKKLFLETDRAKISPEELPYLLENSFLHFIPHPNPRKFREFVDQFMAMPFNPWLFSKFMKRISAMEFVQIIDKSQENDLILAVYNFLSKFNAENKFDYKNTSYFDGFHIISHARILLYFIKHLKKNAYDELYRKIEPSFPPLFLEGLHPSDEPFLYSSDCTVSYNKYILEFVYYFDDILRILDLINEEDGTSGNGKQKTIEILLNKRFFKPYDYTGFKEIIHELLKKIDGDASFIKFTHHAAKNEKNSEMAIKAIIIQKLASYFSSKSLKFYWIHFIKFLKLDLGITNIEFLYYVKSVFFDSAVICRTGNTIYSYSHLFGKQFYSENEHLNIIPVGISKINEQSFERQEVFCSSLEIKINLQSSELSGDSKHDESIQKAKVSEISSILIAQYDSSEFKVDTETTKKSEIIIEENICYVFTTHRDSINIKRAKIVLFAFLSSLVDDEKNKLIFKIMEMCVENFEFNEHSFYKFELNYPFSGLFYRLKKLITSKLSDRLVFIENILRKRFHSLFSPLTKFKFKSFYVFLRENDCFTLDCCLKFISANSKDFGLGPLSQLIFPALKSINKNLNFISIARGFLNIKDQNSALRFIHSVLDCPEIFRDEIYAINNEELSNLINHLISKLNYENPHDVFCLYLIIKRANETCSFTISDGTFSFITDHYKSLGELNIDKKAFEKYQAEIRELEKLFKKHNSQ